jgi:hypothetical protein
LEEKQDSRLGQLAFVLAHSLDGKIVESDSDAKPWKPDRRFLDGDSKDPSVKIPKVIVPKPLANDGHSLSPFTCQGFYPCYVLAHTGKNGITGALGKTISNINEVLCYIKVDKDFCHDPDHASRNSDTQGLIPDAVSAFISFLLFPAACLLVFPTAGVRTPLPSLLLFPLFPFPPCACWRDATRVFYFSSHCG